MDNKPLHKEILVRVPGRANIIGDHTDYNEGFVLPMTIEAGTIVRGGPVDGAHHRITSTRFGESVRFCVGEMPSASETGWATYVGGVLLELHRQAGLRTAMEMEIGGTIPTGAGLSSSASLEIAVAYAAIAIGGLTELTPVDVALIGQRVEHEYVGVKCGIMDQMVCALGKPGHALLLDCRSLEYRHIPVRGASFVIMDSRTKRQLSESAYNRRRQECKVAVAHCRQIDSSVRSLRDVPEADLERFTMSVPEPESKRLEHVVRENGRVLATAGALEAGDLGAVGEAMNASHESLATLFKVSCPELDHLVRVARQEPTCYGARLTGGGFGGCTVCLVDRGREDWFASRVGAAYREAFGIVPRSHIVRNNIGVQLHYA